MAHTFDDDAADLPTWSRTYAGYRQRFVEPFSLPLAPGCAVVLEQAPCVSAEHAKESKASADGSCTASTVWDAGIVLATHAFAERHGSALLDLGSGTGIVGLAAAASGRFERVVLTDLPTVVPLLQRNASANALHSAVEVLPLAWDDEQMLRRVAARGPFELIVGGDLLYRPPVVPPLLHALRALAGSDTTVLLAASLQHSPDTIRLFAEAAAIDGFRVKRLATHAEGDTWFSPEVRVLELTRVEQSASATAAVGGASSTVHEHASAEVGELASSSRRTAPRKRQRRGGSATGSAVQEQLPAR